MPEKKLQGSFLLYFCRMYILDSVWRCWDNDESIRKALKISISIFDKSTFLNMCWRCQGNDWSIKTFPGKFPLCISNSVITPRNCHFGFLNELSSGLIN
jgi:hypothetical protein